MQKVLSAGGGFRMTTGRRTSITSVEHEQDLYSPPPKQLQLLRQYDIFFRMKC